MQSKPNQNFKILLLEDNEDDADLIRLELKSGGIAFTSLVVDTRDDFINGIQHFKPDIIISDHSMPQFNSAEALRIYKTHLKEQNRSAPFILVTGTISEEFAVQCIKDGADDYILKDRLQRLPSAVKNAMEKCSIENENQKAASDKLLLLERYEYVTKATSDAVWDWDIIQNTVYCGEGFEKIFGHARDPQTDNYTLNTAYICIDDIERVMRGIDKVIDGTENNWSDEYKYLKANGEYAFVHDKAIIIRDKEGKAIRMVGAMQDITRKKIEDVRLKLLESVITNTTDAVLIAEVDPLNLQDLKIVYINDAFTMMTGYSNEEVLEKPTSILHGEKTDLAEIAKLQKTLEEKGSCQVEMICYKKNGEEFWLNSSVSPVANDLGDITHWVFIERDITEQRSHTKAIEDQNSQLKEIAWMQSHVVRAPLARMMGFINLIEKKKGTELGNSLLHHVLESGVELDGIIRDIVRKAEKINP
ncbi:MAG: PAS domain-containing protein [Ferruginibacter sp.]